MLCSLRKREDSKWRTNQKWRFDERVFAVGRSVTRMQLSRLGYMRTITPRELCRRGRRGVCVLAQTRLYGLLALRAGRSPFYQSSVGQKHDIAAKKHHDAIAAHQNLNSGSRLTNGRNSLSCVIENRTGYHQRVLCAHFGQRCFTPSDSPRTKCSGGIHTDAYATAATR